MNKFFTLQVWKMISCFLIGSLLFSIQAEAQTTIATRNVSNTTSCQDGNTYGFYINFSGENPLHSLTWGSFSEKDDGTARLSGTIENNSNPGIKFNIDIEFSGRTFNAPAGSPKAHVCLNPNSDNWYYYQSVSGTLTGVGSSWGTNITITNFDPAFQLGNGANQTNNIASFGASGWLNAEIISQNTWGPVLSLPVSSTVQNADININLSGSPLVNTGGCENVTSAGEIAGEQTICSGDAAMTLSSVSMPAGGTGALEFIWLSSTSSCPGSVTQSIAGANGATYNPGVLTQTTYFRRCSRRAGCSAWVGESNCITVTVDQDPACGVVCDNVNSAGEIAGSQTICSGDAAMTLSSVSMPAGGTGALEFIWLSSTSSCPGSVTQSIAGANGATYNPGVLTQTTYFRRCSRRAGCSAWVGESNCITVTVDQDPACGVVCDNVNSAGEIAGSQTICSGDAAMTLSSVSMPAGGTGALEFIWLSSTSSCPSSVTQSIAGANGATYNPGVLTQTTYFRRCSRRAGCSAWVGESNCITVTVDQDPACGVVCDNVDDGGEIAGGQTICSGEAAATLTNVDLPSGGSGSLEYLWLSSTVSCPTSISQQIAGANQATYSPGVLTETTYFVRCSRRTNCDSWTLGESNCVTVMVDNSANCGGSPDCSNVSVTSTNNAINVTGTSGAPNVTVQVFTQPSWSTYFSCSDDCDTPTEVIPAVPGDYLVYVKYYSESWSLICEEQTAITVTTGGGCTDIDNDGTCANEDCDDYDASVPAVVGSSCNDNNANTINDVIQADGCTCLGEIVGGGNGLDLALSVNGDGVDYAIYQQFSVTSTVTNQGNLTSNNIVVNIPQPAGLVFSGGNPFSATQGSYNYYSTYNWNVGTLTPGQSATITLNYFSVAGGPYTIYAQIVAASGNDIDSTPNNGTAPTPNEDDEDVYVTGNGNPNPSCTVPLSASVTNIDCNDNGTPNITADDTFTFDLTVNSGGLWGWTGGGSTGGFGETVSFGPYAIANGNIEFVITDADNATCTATVNVTAPEPCSTTNPPSNGCEDIVISVGNGTINLSGLDNAPLTAVWIFDLDNGWQTVFSCNYGCNPSEVISGLSGNFLVRVKKLNPNWSEICEVQETVFVGIGLPTGVLTLPNPGDITMEVPSGTAGLAFNYLGPIPTTTCPGGQVTLIQLSGLGSGGYFPVGTTTETYQATDECGNTETISFTITITEVSSALILTSPDDIIVNINSNENSAIVPYLEPIASTTCAAGGLTLTRTSGGASATSFPVGTTTITYLATDACGNSETVSFTITVINNISSNLTISCPANITIDASQGNTQEDVFYALPSTSTTCSNSQVTLTRTQGLGSGAWFNIGTTIIEYQATDNCGNTETCFFTITVNPFVNPEPICEIERSATNATTCTNNEDYGIYLSGSHYTISNGTFTENSDGTATLTGMANGLGAIDISFSGRTFTASGSSPFAGSCYTPNTSDWYYYAELSGTIGSWYIYPNSNHTFQVGTGANVQNQNAYGASGWFLTNGGSEGDINIRLTGNTNTLSFDEDCPQPPVVGCGLDVLFVVGNTNLGSGDNAIRNRLEANGYNVMIADDNGIQSSAANGKDLVIISSTVLSSNVNTKFKEVTIPVLTWEGYLFDDMMLTGNSINTNYGSYWGTSQYVVANSSHPINNGLSGTVTIFNSSQDVTWGYPSSASNDIGFIPGYPSQCMIIAYDNGQSMIGSFNAPARRVGFFLQNNTATQLNANGWRLFDQAVEWSTDCYNDFSEEVVEYTDNSDEGDLAEERSEDLIEHKELTSLVIYPNPATDIVNLNITNAEELEITLIVTDQFGRRIENFEFSSFDNQNYRLNTSDYSSGLYFVQIRNSEEIIDTKQLVIMKR